MGLFAEGKLDVRLISYRSQFDCDTSLLRKRTEVACADMARVMEMQGDSAPLRIIMTTEGRMSLMTAKKMRIRTLKHLNERMVALARLSASDYWSDEVMRQGGLDLADIYRPQINDIQLRTTMLMEQLVDGAFLPEPYATLAAWRGHRRLFTTNDSAPSFACLAIRHSLLEDDRRIAQVEKFVSVYNLAANQILTSPNRDTLRSILLQDYQLPRELADTTWAITLGRLPRETETKAAYKWLNSRERRIKPVAIDSLVCTNFLKP